MTAHAPLSPSARYRWSVCPASIRAISTLPEGPSGAAAIDGTHTHTVLEHALKAGPFTPTAHLVGSVMTDHEGRFAVDQDRVDRVTIAMNYIGARVKELGLGTTVLSERRVDPQFLVGRGDMSGTVDVQLLADGFLEIIDYKDGMNEISAVGNKQLEQYAVAVLAEKIAAGDFSINRVRLTIIQPKLAFKGMEPISWVEHDAETILNMATALTFEAQQTDDPNAPFVPGEEQCKYCPYGGRCTAHVAYALKKAGMSFQPTSPEPQQLPQQASQEQPAQMTDERLREIIESAPILRQMITAAEDEALKRITRGHPVLGLKVVRGRGQRKWALPDEEIGKKLEMMGAPKETVWVRSLVSAPQALDGKLIWTNRKGETKQLSERQIKTLEKEFVTKTEGGLSVVPESDRREGVTFADLTNAFGPTASEDASLPSWMS